MSAKSKATLNLLKKLEKWSWCLKRCSRWFQSILWAVVLLLARVHVIPVERQKTILSPPLPRQQWLSSLSFQHSHSVIFPRFFNTSQNSILSSFCWILISLKWSATSSNWVILGIKLHHVLRVKKFTVPQPWWPTDFSSNLLPIMSLKDPCHLK